MQSFSWPLKELRKACGCKYISVYVHTFIICNKHCLVSSIFSFLPLELIFCRPCPQPCSSCSVATKPFPFAAATNDFCMHLRSPSFSYCHLLYQQLSMTSQMHLHSPLTVVLPICHLISYLISYYFVESI